MPVFNTREWRCHEPWISSSTSAEEAGSNTSGLSFRPSDHREQLREIEKYNIKLPADAQKVRTDP